MENNSEYVKKILSSCRHLEDVMNNNILKKFAEIHNVDKNNSHLKIKQELVASTSCFFTKKKYALYIINREGKEVDRYDFKGLVLRRSEYPQYTKTNILKLIDILLKSSDIISAVQEAQSFVKEIETEVEELCYQKSKLVAGAVSYNKRKEEYKKVPYQIGAMELWNELEYFYFTPGTKGSLYRIKGIDPMLAPQEIIDKSSLLLTSKNTNIVLPFEEEKLPDYYLIDIKLQTKFIWTDRVKEIMAAILIRDQHNTNSDKFFENEIKHLFD